MKTMFFMAGFPRSGSTLLTTLLNQHPTLYASHQTHLQPSIKNFVQNHSSQESVMSGYKNNIVKDVVQGMAQSFYQDTDKTHVIDKNREWSTPYSIELAKLINPDVRIIFPVRPILEILTSFIKLASSNPNNYIDRNMANEDFWSFFYRPLNDARCDWLMRPNSQIDAALFGYKLANSPEHAHRFHLVDYQTLCENPQNTLNSIYTFLKVEPVVNNFVNITNKEKLNDGDVFGIPELHNVRSRIKIVAPEPESVLSAYVINKYGNVLTSLENK